MKTIAYSWSDGPRPCDCRSCLGMYHDDYLTRPYYGLRQPPTADEGADQRGTVGAIVIRVLLIR